MQLARLDINSDDVADDFDFFIPGVIDFFGILEMVSSFEEKFSIELDFSDLDAEKIATMGPLSHYARPDCACAEHMISCSIYCSKFVIPLRRL